MAQALTYLDIALLGYSLLTTIAAITPTQKDDKILGRLKNLVDIAKKFRK